MKSKLRERRGSLREDTENECIKKLRVWGKREKEREE